MGWTFDDVATLLVNKRMESPNRAVLSEETKKRIVEANHADQLLYERFCQVFDKKVQAFGENKMKEHVERLIRRTEELRNLCIAENTVDDRHVYVYTLTVKGQTIPYCIYMAATEMELTSMLFDRHNDRYGKKRCARRGY
ncbi:galactosylceramide sulfotransferase-like [Watersipora subatra]|uniref:galactosylceramide sulfotransferase-like n=1 Tax=Watersipora subatra TaxID=2589382 RepID=UPI00355C5B2C